MDGATDAEAPASSDAAAHDFQDRGGGFGEHTAAITAMQDAWTTFASRLRSKLEAIKDPVPDWTMDEFVVYLREYKRRQPATITKRLTQLAFMERHAHMPVKLHADRYTLVNTFYLYVSYREHVEREGAGALINDHKAIRSLGDFLGIPREVWPTRPTMPATDERWLPSPEQVYELLHADYTRYASSSYDNALIRALLTFDFCFGPRFPSEAHVLALKDFRPQQHVIVITEPKKSGRRRTLLIEPEWMCCSTRHPSLETYRSVWRAKVDPDARQTAFFLKSDGEPFSTKDAMRKFVNDAVKPLFPWYHGYLGRHWCANARLIEWDFDYPRVADWLGHETVDMTRREYEHNARLYKRLHGVDWLARVSRTGRRDKGQKRPPGSPSGP